MSLLGKIRAALPGFWLGVLLSLPLAALPAYQGWTFCRHARCCWNLIPVVAAAQDSPAGARLLSERLKVRAILESEVDADLVRSEWLDAVYGAHLLVPIQAGEPVRWSLIRHVHSPRTCEFTRR